jgi:hypothetical protein
MTSHGNDVIEKIGDEGDLAHLEVVGGKEFIEILAR